MIHKVQIKMLYHNLRRLESKLDTLLYSHDTTPETTSNSSASRLTFTIPNGGLNSERIKAKTFCIDKNTAECFLDGDVSIGKPTERRIANGKTTWGGNTYWPMGPVVDIAAVNVFLDDYEQLTCSSCSLLGTFSMDLRITLQKPNGQPCTLEYKKSSGNAKFSY
jgi:hypothetical protein